MNSRQHPFNRGPAPASLLAEGFGRVRVASLALAAPLSEEDCCAQSMPDASPVKWHLAHTTWFFETFILERFEDGFHPFHESFRVLFNSYYNGVGEKHPRPQRGMLTRPPLSLVRQYRADVDRRMAGAIATHGNDRAFRDLVLLGMNHEQQHQELLLTDLKHLLSLNPLAPCYREWPASLPSGPVSAGWADFDGGVVWVGAPSPAAPQSVEPEVEGDQDESDDGFCFDNELPRHRQYLEAYRLGTRLVTNAEYLGFVEAGGYRDAQLWLSEGWDWVRGNGIEHPVYWLRGNDGWREFTLAGLRALDPGLPVAHVSYFEADAYARFAGARLPTEGEWEHASETCSRDGHFCEEQRYHPLPAKGPGLCQMFGDLWEWTSSSYSPYPGFQAPEGAIGEYNGKFMVNQYVLRGGSCATPRDHIRPSYRNFFPTSARWQFTGIRLAHSI